MMGGVSFLTPVFLAGAVAVAIPVIIHLIRSRQTRIHPFSSLRFLRLSYQRTSRRLQLEEALLLILRCLLVLLMALALAKPLARAVPPPTAVSAPPTRADFRKMRRETGFGAISCLLSETSIRIL